MKLSLFNFLTCGLIKSTEKTIDIKNALYLDNEESETYGDFTCINFIAYIVRFSREECYYLDYLISFLGTSKSNLQKRRMRFEKYLEYNGNSILSAYKNIARIRNLLSMRIGNISMLHMVSISWG